MMPLLRLATLATIAIGLSGCATIRDWWSDEDKGPEPAPLVELKGAPDVKRLWSADSGKGSAELVLALNVAADEEAVFIADRSGTVSAFRAADGSRLWASETRAALSAGPGLAGDVVVVGGSEGEVIALDRKSGGTRWKARASSEVLAAPVGTDELVITRSGDGTVNVYATADGKALWSAGEATPPLSLRGVSRPLYVQGGIVAGFAGGKLTAFDGRNGAVLWDARVGVPSGRTELERIVDLDADPVRREDIVYVAAWQQHVAAVSLRGGDVVWRQPLFTAGALAADARRIYASDANGQVKALDRASGTPVWEQGALAYRGLTGVALHGDYVVVGDAQGYLHWLARQDGKPVTRVRGPSGRYRQAPLVIGDTLYALGEDGELGVFGLPATP